MKPRKAKASTPVRTPVIANRTWRVDQRVVEHHLMHIVITGPRPCWAFDLAELFAAIAHAIESGSPHARAWAIAQSGILADAFGPRPIP